MKKETKILVVDDQVENLEVIVNIVEMVDKDMTVFQALNGDMAFKIANHENLDLIITDWEMPGMSGVELIRKLKQHKSTEDIPVIMCTGIMTKSENLRTALDAGAVDYIRKPVDEIELQSRLKSMVQLSDSLRTIKKQKEELAKEMEKSEELLHNILPDEIAQELKDKGEAEPKLIKSASVLFTDFKGFTAYAESMTPKELVHDIHKCFTGFDRIIEKHGIEKIKTIGDAYMCAGGLPLENDSHAQNVVNAALEIRDFIEKGKQDKLSKGEPFFEVRIGVHTGSVVAGIVGVKKFSYDIWGDTVNVASRMESSGEAGKVNVSESTYNLIKSIDDYQFESRGKIEAKGKGEMDMYFVENIS